MNLKDLIVAFIAFREEVVTRRTRFELNKARDRAHILAGWPSRWPISTKSSPYPGRAGCHDRARTIDGADWPASDVGPLVALIADPRNSIAEDGTIRLTEEQAKAILDLRLQRLTALGRDEIADEVKTLSDGDQGLSRYSFLLASAGAHDRQGRTERDQDGIRDAPPTELVDADVEVEDEALIEREDVAVTVTHGGYIKRTPLADYRVQGRGGKGRSGMATREEDFVTPLFVASTHAPLLFFSSTGMA